MENIIVTNKIKMEVIKYFGYENYEAEKNFYLNEVPDELFKFYYRCLRNDIDVCDADRYANLNTVVGYDVGFYNFHKIDDYLWVEKDYDLMELFGNEDGKQIIEEAIKILNLDVDLSNWNDGEIKEYIYYV